MGRWIEIHASILDGHSQDSDVIFEGDSDLSLERNGAFTFSLLPPIPAPNPKYPQDTTPDATAHFR